MSQLALKVHMYSMAIDLSAADPALAYDETFTWADGSKTTLNVPAEVSRTASAFVDAIIAALPVNRLPHRDVGITTEFKVSDLGPDSPSVLTGTAISTVQQTYDATMLVGLSAAAGFLLG